MDEKEYQNNWLNTWYCDYFWIWYYAKKEMYNQWHFLCKEGKDE